MKYWHWIIWKAWLTGSQKDSRWLGVQQAGRRHGRYMRNISRRLLFLTFGWSEWTDWSWPERSRKRILQRLSSFYPHIKILSMPKKGYSTEYPIICWSMSWVKSHCWPSLRISKPSWQNSQKRKKYTRNILWSSWSINRMPCRGLRRWI